MKFERAEVFNMENAFHGLRHPMESYHLSDSEIGYSEKYHKTMFLLGRKDVDLAQRMIKAGTPNDKFLRQILVSVDITGSLFWFKEMDTYKVATVSNSTSTMHKLATTPITIDCFEIDDFDEAAACTELGFCFPYQIIEYLEKLRLKYLETKDKRYWKELIRWLPESWLQTRTWTANYATLRSIIHWRQNHKLTEWHQFVDWCRELPYAEELLFYNNEPGEE